MYRKILVGYDDSDQAKDALALGKQLAGPTAAKLVLGGVFRFDPLWGELGLEIRDEEIELARRIEAAAEAVGAEAEATPSSSPARGLHELAEEIGADLIVVGSAHHGRIGQIAAGSVGVSLLHGSPCAVGIAPYGYRDRPQEGIGTVAVGYDASVEAGLALAAASELATSTGATLTIVSVVEPPPLTMGKGGNVGRQELMEAIEAQVRRELAEARESVPVGIEVEAHVISGDPVESLSSVGRAAGTLLFVGSRAYGPVRGVLLGSVSRQLVRSAPCPLIITPRGMHVDADSAGREEVESAS